VLAIILAGCSWPLLYIALVRAQIKFYDLPTMIVFLSWIASGLFWGVFVGLLYRLIRYKRPNTFLEPTTTEPRVLTDYEI
jgi:heme/copper-type cytochrome/quinol oxidase subunit 2